MKSLPGQLRDSQLARVRAALATGTPGQPPSPAAGPRRTRWKPHPATRLCRAAGWAKLRRVRRSGLEPYLHTCPSPMTVNRASTNLGSLFTERSTIFLPRTKLSAGGAGTATRPSGGEISFGLCLRAPMQSNLRPETELRRDKAAAGHRRMGLQEARAIRRSAARPDGLTSPPASRSPRILSPWGGCRPHLKSSHIWRRP